MTLLWVAQASQRLRPYAQLARVEKSIGTWLFFWPFAWSISMAASTGSLPDLKTLAVFGCAAPLLRGAACTINDILDRDFDRMVGFLSTERGFSRPTKAQRGVDSWLKEVAFSSLSRFT
ncbi:UbiA prenyltransferase family [Corchorus capsularis]|uniref:UbiA prenyltransferase family n=1 Tax=Corchorus capsularis TaxID=210143 RepID=A0A1R3GNM3_COCAP|nr:UbiA prenyltransferase family [Corchorus capsularis]